METLGYIYTIIRKAMEKNIPVEEALELIRKFLCE